jgi:hypothetical protein
MIFLREFILWMNSSNIKFKGSLAILSPFVKYITYLYIFNR